MITRTDPLSFPLIQYPIALLDYFRVIIIYVIIGFGLATIIDGHILPPFDREKVNAQSTPVLAIRVILQFALQGFIAIFICALVQKIPSPFNGINGYDTNSTLGLLIINPAIITMLLFALSRSLQGSLYILYSRFNQNELNELNQTRGKTKSNNVNICEIDKRI